MAPLPEPPRLALCDGLAAGGFTDAPGAPLLSRRLLSKALESQIEGRCPGSTVASGALAIIQQGGCEPDSVHLDDRREAIFEAREAEPAQNAAFRLRKRPQGRLSYDAEAALATDEEAAEVRPDRTLRRHGPLEDAAVRKNSREPKHLVAHRAVFRPAVPERVC